MNASRIFQNLPLFRGKVFYALSHSLAKVARIRRTNEPMKELIRQHADRLAPGIYLIQGGLAYKQGCHLPDHLKSSRLKSAHSIKPIWLKHWVRTMLTIGTNWVRIDGVPRGFPILTSKPRNNKWDVVLLNPEQGQVMRICRKACFTPDYMMLREQAASYLTTPRFEVHEGGYSILEEYIEGKHLRDYSADEVRLTIEYLLDQIRYGAANLAVAPSNNTAQTIQTYLNKTGLTCLEPIILCDLKVLTELLCAPKMPANNDLHLDNVIVAEQGPIVIDWDPKIVNRMPFWYDAVNLLLKGDRIGFWRGTYDSQLCSIFEVFPSSKFNLSEHRWELKVAQTILEYPLLRSADFSIIPELSMIPEHSLQHPVHHFKSCWNKKVARHKS